MKKVVMIVTNNYNPDIRVHKEAKYLVGKGFDVEILSWDRENDFINKKNENIDGITIRRFFPYAKYGTGIKQIIAYIKFVFEVKKYLSKIEFNYLHCHDLDGIITGYIGNTKDSKLIFDMHEIYEIQGEKLKYKKIIRPIVSYLQKESDSIIYVTDLQIREIKDKLKSKLIYLPNYPDTNDYLDIEKQQNSTLNISYIGAVRQFNELKNLMDACNKIENIIVSIHGAGTAYSRLNKIKANYSNVNVTGRYIKEDSSKFYSNTDISYIVYSKENPQHLSSYPIKFFEAIITKTPMIVNKDSLLEQFVINNDIGFAIDSSNVEELKELIIHINNNKQILEEKIKNLEKIQFHYKWNEVVKNLDTIYM